MPNEDDRNQVLQTPTPKQDPYQGSRSKSVNKIGQPNDHNISEFKIVPNTTDEMDDQMMNEYESKVPLTNRQRENSLPLRDKESKLMQNLQHQDYRGVLQNRQALPKPNLTKCQRSQSAMGVAEPPSSRLAPSKFESKIPRVQVRSINSSTNQFESRQRLTKF